jgi:transcriptional regulator GlxA family with amidase domain
MAFLPLDGSSGGCEAGAMNAEILLFDGFDELDALGPWELLTGVADAALVTLEGPRAVPADHGAVIQAQRALSERPDLLLIPGGGWLTRSPQGVYAEVQRGVIPEAIAHRHAAGTTIASVCTGALLVAAGGLLDGREATTNPGAYDDLRAMGATVIETRVVDDGDIVTAGAPACGLDLVLHLIEREGGSRAATAAARELQYERPVGAVHVGARGLPARA